MDLYDAIDQRRTVREFLDKEVDFEAIKRILEAGNKAPTWNHNRNWSYIVLRTDEEKEYAFEYVYFRLCGNSRSYHLDKHQSMYYNTSEK